MRLHKNRKTKTTEKEESIYNYIKKYVIEHGYPPSIREIGDGTGIKSTSTVHLYVNKLIESGRLESDAGYGTPRAIRVPELLITERWNVSGAK